MWFTEWFNEWFIEFIEFIELSVFMNGVGGEMALMFSGIVI